MKLDYFLKSRTLFLRFPFPLGVLVLENYPLFHSFLTVIAFCGFIGCHALMAIAQCVAAVDLKDAQRQSEREAIMDAYMSSRFKIGCCGAACGILVFQLVIHSPGVAK